MYDVFSYSPWCSTKINRRLLLFAVGFCSFSGTFFLFAVRAGNNLKGAFRIFAAIAFGSVLCDVRYAISCDNDSKLECGDGVHIPTSRSGTGEGGR